MAVCRTKNSNKVAALMTEDVQFRLGGIFEKPTFKIGRLAFLDYYAQALKIRTLWSRAPPTRWATAMLRMNLVSSTFIALSS